MTPGTGHTLYGRLVDKFLVLTRWPTARKVAVSGLLAYPIYLLFYGLIVYSRAAGWGRGVIDLNLLEWISRNWITVAPFITLAAFVEDRLGREGRWTAYTFVLVGGLQLVVTIQFFGTVSTSLITLIALTILFLTLFFDTGIGWAGFWWQAFLFIAVAFAELSGAVPYAPVLLTRELGSQAGTVYQLLLLGTLWIVFANLFLRIQFTASIRHRQMTLLEERHRELKEAKDRLARSEALSGIATLASGAAHEIRNPLGSCNALMQTVIEDLDVAPEPPRSELAGHARAVTTRIGIAGASIQDLHRLIDDVERARQTGKEMETLQTLGVVTAESGYQGPERAELGLLAWWFSRIVKWPLAKRAVVESFAGMGALILAWIPMALFLGRGFPPGIARWTGLWALVCGLSGAVFLRLGTSANNVRWPVHLLHAAHTVFGLTLCAELGGMSTSFYAMLPGWVLVISLFYDSRTGISAFLCWLAGSAVLAALEITGAIPYAPAFAGWTVDSFAQPEPYVFLIGVYLLTFTGVFVFVASSERLRRTQEGWIERASRELENAREAVARTESLAALGTLVGRAVGSIRPPVQAAGEALEQLSRITEDSGSLPGPLRKDLSTTIDMAARGQRRAARILDRLALLSELAGKSPGTCDVNRAIERVTASYPGVCVESHPGEIRAPVSAAELELILSELVDNAQKSGASEPPQIQVMADGNITITVEDHGRGVPDSLKADLFKPFASGDRSGEGHGVGLGLYLVHEIIRLNGGSVSITSAPPGGTAVTLTLPECAS